MLSLKPFLAERAELPPSAALRARSLLSPAGRANLTRSSPKERESLESRIPQEAFSCEILRLIDSTFLGRDAIDLDGSGNHGRGIEPVGRLPDSAASGRQTGVRADPGQDVRIGVLLDTETTGLDHAKDEIIELGMVKFDYTSDGRIVGVRGTFSALNEPSAPISAEVTALTGRRDGGGSQIRRGGRHGLRRPCRHRHCPQQRLRQENSSSATGPCSSTRPGAEA